MGALKRLIDNKRQDVVQQPYPVPQTQVNTAREVGPHVPREQAHAKGDNVIDGEFHEVHDKKKGKGLAVSGEFAAIGREAVKDIRGTMMQVFFGQPEHQSEPGTPLNPTQIMVTREIDGKEKGGMDFER